MKIGMQRKRISSQFTSPKFEGLLGVFLRLPKSHIMIAIYFITARGFALLQSEKCILRCSKHVRYMSCYMIYVRALPTYICTLHKFVGG